MTEVQSPDAELIAAARVGDEQSYAELFRRHSGPALRFARSLGASAADADDLVAEAFARVLAAIKGGHGPEESFRPYLLSAVRNAFYDSARRSAKEQAVGDLTPLAPEVPFVDPVMAREESRLVATAFGELPERWQVVLWHTEVEGEKPAEVAPLLGISPNAVAALAYRAREGLRERYLQAHLATTTDDGCRATVDKLGAYTRQRLTATESARVRAHLDTCDRCSLLFGQLSDVNAGLGSLVGPVVLGGAAAAYAASAIGGGGATGGAGVGAAGRLRRIAKRRDAQAAGVGVLVVGLVAVTLSIASARGEGGNSPAPAAAATPARQSVVPVPTPTHPTTDPATSPAPSASPTKSPSSKASTAASSDPVPTSEQPTPSDLPPIAPAGSFDPVGSLVRGRLGVLDLALAKPATASQASQALQHLAAAAAAFAADDLTATFTFPAGVTLRSADPGDGWSCAGTTCTHAPLAAGTSTRAHVPVTVSSGAANGTPTVQISGSGFATTTLTSSRGVEGAGLGAVFVGTGNLAVAATGNSLLSCPDVAFGCTSARAGGTGGTDNNDYAMTPYAAPGAPSGAPAGAAVSGASISLGGDVVWAGLYWAGTGTAPTAPTAYVRPPGAASYQQVTPRRVDQLPASGGDGAMYQATADITDLAATADGTWWVAVPSNAFTAGVNTFGGWAIIAVVRDGSASRTVSVFDAMRVLRSGGGDSFSDTVTGAPNAPVSAAFVSWEGDRGTTGDSLSLGAGKLGGTNQNNIARSQTDGTPSGWNTFGTDARVVAGTFGPSAVPTVTAATTGDTWLLGALALAS